MRVEGRLNTPDIIRKVKIAAEALKVPIFFEHLLSDGRKVITTEALPLSDIKGLVKTTYELNNPNAFRKILSAALKDPEEPILYRYRG